MPVGYLLRAQPPAMIEAIADSTALMAAWRRVNRNGGGAGGEGESLEEFARDLDAGIGRLSREIFGGRYSPRPLRRYPIAKTGGGVRWLAVPAVRDRVVQTAAAAVLSSRAEPAMSQDSFAYRKGRSIEHALGCVTANRLAGFGYAVDGDIADFFGALRHEAVMAALSPVARCDRTMALVAAWLAGFSWSGNGLAQGSPISPVLSNLALTAVDEAIVSRRVRLVRYADDLLLMTRTRHEAEAARERFARLIAPLGLELNPAKTRIVALADGVTFLGFRLADDRLSKDGAA